ncbi:hypothetical protein CMI37_18440 [Candidatus Pacearchaeota archaeon]|nr:hypothetical protein [Candidatus Pacearchaeota archaeon]|tara:strand:- start:468 stop:677 length:210 start_codon:yes stop_codon:yes gene_type:complete
MGEVFKAKVRNVGTSFGILLPVSVVREEGIKLGQEVEVSLLKKNLRLIRESFGIDKGASKFERDHRDRF